MSQRAPSLTPLLTEQLVKVSVAAVQAKDVASLKMLHAMGVDLSQALSTACINGFHDITSGLRQLGVVPTEEQVRWAVAKSPESYKRLCLNGKLEHPTAALQEAITHAKFGLAHELLEQPGFELGENIDQHIFRSKKPIQQALLAKILDRLSPPYSNAMLTRVAQFGTPALLERAMFVSPNANAALLFADAMKFGNEPVGRDLLFKFRKIPIGLLSHYRAAAGGPGWYAEPGILIDAKFFGALADAGWQFSADDLLPQAMDFVRRRRLMGFLQEVREGDLHFMKSLLRVVKPGEDAHLLSAVEAQMEAHWNKPSVEEMRSCFSSIAAAALLELQNDPAPSP